MSSMVSNPVIRKLEDDNFIIGTGLKYDRMRQDARQLQRSKFKETQSKANFARFRNAALKCAVEATGKTIEQEKSIRMREIERERGKIIAIQKRCGKCLLTAKLNPIVPETKYRGKEKRKMTKNISPTEEDSGAGGVHSLSPSSACAESWMQRNQSADLSHGKDKMTTLEPERENSARGQMTTSAKSNRGRLDVDQFTPQSRTTLPGKRGSLPLLSDTSSVSSVTKDEAKNSACLLDVITNISVGGSPGLCRSSSTKTVRIHSVDVNIKRRNTISTVGHLHDKRREKIFEKEKEKEFQVWQNFDELLKWFAEFMQIDYKPRLAIKESDVTKDAHAQNTPRVLLPKGSFSPLYFKYGVPENFVIRLC